MDLWICKGSLSKDTKKGGGIGVFRNQQFDLEATLPLLLLNNYHHHQKHPKEVRFQRRKT